MSTKIRDEHHILPRAAELRLAEILRAERREMADYPDKALDVRVAVIVAIHRSAELSRGSVLVPRISSVVLAELAAAGYLVEESGEFTHIFWGQA